MKSINLESEPSAKQAPLPVFDMDDMSYSTYVNIIGVGKAFPEHGTSQGRRCHGGPIVAQHPPTAGWLLGQLFTTMTGGYDCVA